MKRDKGSLIALVPSNDLPVMHFEDAALAALGDEIRFKFGPGSQLLPAGAAMDWGVAGHVLRERKIDGVALGTNELIVQALGGGTAHKCLAVSRSNPICAINRS